MNLETKATLKRIAVLLCSMSVLGFFGYAIRGMGGYLVGRGNPPAIAMGLSGGASLSYAAIRIWKSYLADAEALNARDREDGSPHPEDR